MDMDMDMDMDLSNAQNKEMSSQTLESMLACTKPQQEKKPRPQDEVQKCPRCDSTNTKFCYYNNYSLTQPRYFCKSCRRYWTKGGTLRNVPVGGGCRKKQRSSSSKRSSPDNQSLMTTTTTCPNNQIISCLTQFSYDPNDLSLAFSRLQNQESGQLVCPESIQTETIFPDSLCLTNFGNSDAHHDVLENRGMCTPSSEVISHVGFLDALRGGFLETPPNGFLNHNLYYYGSIGNNGNHMGHVESGSHGEMVTNFDQEVRSGATTSIALKEEMCSDNKILWGYPWQINGDGNVADFEYSSRQNWNGLGVPSGHGLLNSPLM